ncbi:hypothetical protein FHW12_000367 [Dokdonella fugitiva]|uniref:Uncharacterized protein n=1 Tax=Dokdonella fugitiva TaxID=328517 RepID=A0A839EUT6_9GAMM|nr:hypothetical protein [Dokdonella fugitiva]MBA8886176.1 hypothetical protein [Dokdonella fugitiva]
MATMTVMIKGTRPMLMHSLRLLNKMDPLTKERSRYTSIKKKTDADEVEIQRIDWLGALYHDDELGPYLPAENIEAAIVEGAKLSKGGRDVKRGVSVLEDRVRLDYDGPRDIKALYNGGDSRFIDARGVRNQASRVIRCRPIFLQWAATFTVSFDTAVIKDADTLIGFIADAGRFCGIGDYRPRFGRFDIVETRQ